MALTLSEARSIVLARLGVAPGEGDITGLVDIQLDQEYQLLVLEHELLVDTADLIVNVGDPVVDLPNDLAVPLTLRWGSALLNERTWSEFAEDRDKGVFYVRSGASQIRLSVTPTTADEGTISCWYAMEAPAWDTDIDTPSALPGPFHPLPVERAIEFLALLEEEQGLAQAAKIRADQLEERLVRHLGRRGGPGRSSIPVKGLS